MARQTAILVDGIIPSPGGNSFIGIGFPVRPGARPYTERTKSRQQALLMLERRGAATAANSSTVSVFGAHLPLSGIDDAAVDANGRILRRFLNSGSVANTLQQLGGYVEKVRLVAGSTGAATSATGISFVTVLNGGSGYTSAPTVVFSSGAAAGTAIVKGGRVVGVTVTNAGTGYTSAPRVSFTGGGGSGAIAACGLGQINTINTHIPFQTHAPQTNGGFAYFVMWRDRLIPVTGTTSSSVPGLAAIDGNIGLDPDQHVLGAGTAATCGLTVATGTHLDGTTTVAILTVGAPATNGSNFGFPAGDTVTVFCVPVAEVLAGGAGAAADASARLELSLPDVLYTVITGAATASADVGSSSVVVSPSVN